MRISSPDDYREAARQRLPRFLFDYLDGGSYDEQTLKRNASDFDKLTLRQRVLAGSDDIDVSVELLGSEYALPIGLSPVGLNGMYARRGEVQSARAAEAAGVPFTLSTVSVCPIDEVSSAVSSPIWFQLYVLRDRAFMKDVLERALAAGVETLVFTVDMPVPGARYRDRHSGMSGPGANFRRIWQAMAHPTWAMDVGLFGRPHDLGNISAYRGKRTNLSDYIGWIGENFDPGISWTELDWIRSFWPGKLIIKGILDRGDVAPALEMGADGLVVSNHGGRQLDGVSSTIKALPDIAEAVDGRAAVILDGGIRSGLDVIRALCLGADFTMIGRAYMYALAAGGQSAVETLLAQFTSEMTVAMTLMGVHRIDELNEDNLHNA